MWLVRAIGMWLMRAIAIEVFLGLFSKMWGFVFVCNGVRKIEVRAFGILAACFSTELGILTNLEVFLLDRFS
jgi:hypothetical protein